ncbi:hypothetical protein [Catelliglobosispora koreensis]|uniref:hypothetical protein n=1 Tax=Catelliglobosispora koreensis TaxID=129052 RepID=UPI000365D649|nr:hypothetical protein [Catelliglobosispora koreensis]
MDLWVLARFVHVVGAAFWVGGQLLLALVVMPLARRQLDSEIRHHLMAAAGRRFARLTLAVALPLQIGTGIALAAHNSVTWASLAEPGYGRTLAAKLGLLTIAMMFAAGHGIAAAKGHRSMSRALSAAGLACSAGVILLATALAG